MNYSECIQSLSREVKEKRQRKELSMPLRVFSVFGLLPFVILAFLQMIGFYVTLFFYKATASLADYLEGWVDDKKKDVRHATEAVLFFVTMPFIFFVRILLSIFSIIFYISWFFLQVFTYITSLGGIVWTPYIQDVCRERPARAWRPATNYTAATIFIILSCVIYFFFLIFNIIYLFVDEDFVIVSCVFSLIYYLFVAIALPLIFKKKFADETAVADNTPLQVFDEGELPEL